MKAVWSALLVGLLGAATLGGATSAQASGLTRAEVLAELADYQSVGYQFKDVDYPQVAMDATRKVVALRAERAAAAAANAGKAVDWQGAWTSGD
jgi:hypothetical protein